LIPFKVKEQEDVNVKMPIVDREFMNRFFVNLRNKKRKTMKMLKKGKKKAVKLRKGVEKYHSRVRKAGRDMDFRFL